MSHHNSPLRVSHFAMKAHTSVSRRVVLVNGVPCDIERNQAITKYPQSTANIVDKLWRQQECCLLVKEVKLKFIKLRVLWAL